MKRELIVTANGVERTVVVDGPIDGGTAARGSNAGTFRVSIDGTERLVDAHAIRPGTWSLLLDGASFVVDLDPRRNGTVAASVGASDVVLGVEDARQRRLAQATGARAKQSGETLRAPIAGKVVKVLVELGAVVAPGTPVIVLEAMKMENEIVAEHGGTVAKIHKTAGQPVDTGDTLVELT
jgi:glutaconyl-CoA/methylmalonyl-CoA decarboxylase subunit gamma